MRGFRNSPFMQFFSSRIGLGALALVLVWLVGGTVREVSRAREAQKELEGLKQEITELEGKNSELRALIGYFGNSDYIEQEARSRLNLKKPGEGVIILVEEATSTDGSTQTHDTENKGWFNSIF